MTTNLTRFFQSDDLNELMQIATQLPPLTEDDYAAAQNMVENWNNPQAIANILMYTQLVIRPEQHAQTLLKGLYDEANPYIILAATIGLQEAAESFSEEEIARIEARLLQLIVHTDQTISARAAMTLFDYLTMAGAERAIALLAHPNPSVKHNLLVALVKVVGVAKIRPTLEKSPAYQALSAKIRTLITEKLVILDSIIQPDGTIDRVALLSSELGAPLMTYIPNLSDF